MEKVHQRGFLGNSEHPESEEIKQVQEAKAIQLLDRLKINMSERAEKPDTILSIGESRISTLGNFSLIIGKAKSKKTFLTGIFSAAALSSKEVCGINGSLPSHKSKVLYIDTEQGTWDVQNSIERIHRQADDHTHKNLLAYEFREAGYEQRKYLVNYLIETTPDIGLVVIDGIRDLVSSINSEEEATNTADWLLNLTKRYNIHIITILHQNKNDNNARGHLGTELINKSETVLSVQKVEKQKFISMVIPEYCRGIDFEDFYFSVDETGLPYLVDKEVIGTDGRAKIDLTGLDNISCLDVLDDVFKDNEEITAADLIQELKYSLKTVKGIEVGRDKVKDFITHLTKIKYIERENNKKPYKRVKS